MLFFIKVTLNVASGLLLLFSTTAALHHRSYFILKYQQIYDFLLIYTSHRHNIVHPYTNVFSDILHPI